MPVSHTIFTRAEARAQVKRAVAEREARLVHHLAFEGTNGRRAFVMRDPIEVRRNSEVSDASLFLVKYRVDGVAAHRDDWIAPNRDAAITAAKLYCGMKT